MIGSLFTGTGGLDMAVQEFAGLPVGFVADIDPGACKLLAHRCSDVPNLGDVTTVDWEPWRGRVSVLTGGFPCQDISVAGNRVGLGGARSGLWSEFHRAIDQLRPGLVVIENVRGLLSARTDRSEDVRLVGPRGGARMGRTHRALGIVLEDLADIGYDAQWTSLRAADVGAAHGRFRVFIVAHPAGDPDALDRYRRPTAGQPRETRPTAGFASDAEGDGWDERWPESTRVAGRPNAPLGGGEAVGLLPTPNANLGSNGGSQDPEKRRAGNHTVSLQDVAEHVPLGKYQEAVDRHARMLGRTAPDPTEPAPRGGQRLSPRFVEWLMCLPGGWVTDVPELSWPEQLRLLGNGVVPPQAEAALTTIGGPPWLT